MTRHAHDGASAPGNADVPQNADNQMPPRTEEDIKTIRAALDACATGSTHECWQAQDAICAHAEAYIEVLLDTAPTSWPSAPSGASLP